MSLAGEDIFECGRRRTIHLFVACSGTCFRGFFRAIRTAGRSGIAGGESGKAFRDAMRNKVDPVETVDLAKDALREMHSRKSAAYREGMGKVSGDPTVLSFVAEIIIGKQRNGPIGKLCVVQGTVMRMRIISILE